MAIAIVLILAGIAFAIIGIAFLVVVILRDARHNHNGIPKMLICFIVTAVLIWQRIEQMKKIQSLQYEPPETPQYKGI